MHKSFYRQKGAALILVTFIIALASSFYLLKVYDPARLRIEQDKRTFIELNQAKQALIAWAVSHSNYPGQMLFPDRNGDGNYDGKSDCNSPVSTFSYSFFLGQLPIYGQDNPCVAPQVGIGNDFRDAQGNRLWYAVSRNLVHKYESPSADPIINPGIISSLVYPWLIVKDRNGVIISDRVAAVILAPGNPLGGQNRSTVAPNVAQFLDTFQIGASTFSNANYDSADEDFVIGQDSRDVGELDTSVIKPYYFNDKLVYVTIDELMDAVNNRASSEAAKLLNLYRNKNGQFPYAANLGATLNNHNSSGTSTNGMLPIDVTDSCSCSSDTSCTCSFLPISSVALKRDAGTWNAALDTGSCSSALGAPSDTCVCTGAGSCSRFATNFSCTPAGLCMHDLPTPNNKFIYSVPPDYADIYAASPGLSPGCRIVSTSQAECDNAGTFSIGLKEPVWFKTNLWQDYFYYQWSPTVNLQSGAKMGIAALLIGVGEPIVNPPYAAKGAPQSRPPINPVASLDDYLDSVENTDGDNIFDATNKINTNDYNDQVFVIAP